MSRCLPCEASRAEGLGAAMPPIPQGIQRYQTGVATPMEWLGIYLVGAAAFALCAFAGFKGYQLAKRGR